MTARPDKMLLKCQFLTTLICTCSIILIEQSRMIPGSEPNRLQLWVAALACLFFAIIGGMISQFARSNRLIYLMFCAMGSIPFAEMLYPWQSGHSIPTLEKNLMLGIECLIVVMCLFTQQWKIRRLSLFLAGLMAIMSFAVIPEMQGLSMGVMIQIIIALPLWLYFEHRFAGPRRIQEKVDQTIEEPAKIRIRNRPAVLRMMIWITILAVASYLLKGDRQIRYVIAEWVGSSGGTGETDEMATSGVGDGPNEVAASQNAESVGFTDSEIYLETDRPSLFDAFNEQYGEPFKRQKVERMQAMGPQNMKETESRPKENLEAGRTFELQRQQADKSRKIEDRPATALAFVQGPADTRLKLASFDQFDGKTWSMEHDCNDNCQLSSEIKTNKSCWFCLHYPYPVTELFQETVNHKIKLANLDTSVLPAPANLWKFHVGGIRESEMFGWAGVNVIRIKDRTFPAGTTLETQSRRVSRKQLIQLHFHDLISKSKHDKHFQGNGTDILSVSVRNLVESWNLGTERSWIQVERLISRLKNHAVLETGVDSQRIEANRVPLEQSADPITDFLVDRRSGPDYLFATSAATILRTLGYPCRLVSGFYVDPETYDGKKAHYALTSKNLHFWVEILLPNSIWVPIDPSPGFDTEYAHETYADMVFIWGWFVVSWIVRNQIAILTISVMFSISFLLRRWLYDQVIVIYLNTVPVACDRSRVLATVRHLEWRAGRFFGTRPLDRSFRYYFQSLPIQLEKHERLIQLGEWAAYAPLEKGADYKSNEIREICQKAVSEMSCSFLRRFKHSKGGEQ